MEKFIPYEKLSKKEKRKMDLAKRQTWGELNPVTRKPETSKAYSRKRTQDWKKELPDLRPFVYLRLSFNRAIIREDSPLSFVRIRRIGIPHFCKTLFFIVSRSAWRLPSA